MHLLFLLLALAATFGACIERGRADEWIASEHPNIAWFQGGRSFALVDLDTGEWRVRKLRTQMIPYTSSELTNGRLLVSYVDESLSCGFLLLDQEGSALYRKDGYAAYVFGDDIVLAVHLGEALETRPAEYSVEVIDTENPGAAVHYENTFALSPMGRDWRSLQNAGDPTPLLVTYTPRGFGADYLYPWTKDLRVSALKLDGRVAWISGIRARNLLTNLELLYTGQDVHLLYGKHDYFSGEYVLLDAITGRVLWHTRNTIIPVSKTQHPYVNFHGFLPVETQESTLRFPAYDSRVQELNVAEIDLRRGGIELLDDKEWLAEADRAFKKAQEPPTSVSAWSEELSTGETLALTRDSLSLSINGAETWARPAVPDFGENLELAAAGEELVLLVERPGRTAALSSQGVPHLIDRSAGKDVRIPVDGNPAVCEPLMFGERLLLLTSDDVRLVEWLPVSDSGAS